MVLFVRRSVNLRLVPQVIKALRPAFEKMMPQSGRKWLAGEGICELYTESEISADAALESVPGKVTIGVDGHKDGRHRSVLTISFLKQTISTFKEAFYPKTNRQTGSFMAGVLKEHILANEKDIIAVVADNTGNMQAMFEELEPLFPFIFFVGCCVHVLDLIIEDICKIREIADILNDIRFLVTFVKGHDVLHEEFLRLQSIHKLSCALKVFPHTRFAYAYQMAHTVIENSLVFAVLLKTAIFKASCATQSKRGKDGQTSAAEHARFKSLINDEKFNDRVLAVHELLECFSQVLHYVEGDSAPPSHVLPLYQSLFDYVNAVPDVIKNVLDKETLEKVVGVVEDRWIGIKGSRKVPLKCDILLASFALDPYAQIACSDSLLSTDVDAALGRLVCLCA